MTGTPECDRNEQAQRLALQAFVQPTVYFCCNQCDAELLKTGISICLAAYSAVSDGWRINEASQVYCSACAEKLP